MTQKQKDLLLKDLCGRLSHGVKCAEVYPDGNKFENEWDIIKISKYVEDGIHISNCKTIYGYCSSIENIKPYLFPLSSMTEEQLYNNPVGFSQMLTIKADRDWENITINRRSYYKLVDWFNKNHFDYRGLIPMGLAIDATGLNIY